MRWRHLLHFMAHMCVEKSSTLTRYISITNCGTILYYSARRPTYSASGAPLNLKSHYILRTMYCERWRARYKLKDAVIAICALVTVNIKRWFKNRSGVYFHSLERDILNRIKIQVFFSILLESAVKIIIIVLHYKEGIS